MRGMGYVSGYDLENEHEGWVAMTYADGTMSSGTSNAQGHYPDGYTYDPERPGHINEEPRPFSEVAGWLPRCECGWTGIEVPVSDEPNQYREPNDHEENLIMGQWRLHIRDTNPEAYRA
jgi:hypothetical protein